MLFTQTPTPSPPQVTPTWNCTLHRFIQKSDNKWKSFGAQTFSQAQATPPDSKGHRYEQGPLCCLLKDHFECRIWHEHSLPHSSHSTGEQPDFGWLEESSENRSYFFLLACIYWKRDVGGTFTNLMQLCFHSLTRRILIWTMIKPVSIIWIVVSAV